MAVLDANSALDPTFLIIIIIAFIDNKKGGHYWPMCHTNMFTTLHYITGYIYYTTGYIRCSTD